MLSGLPQAQQREDRRHGAVPQRPGGQPAQPLLHIAHKAVGDQRHQGDGDQPPGDLAPLALGREGGDLLHIVLLPDLGGHAGQVRPAQDGQHLGPRRGLDLVGQVLVPLGDQHLPDGRELPPQLGDHLLQLVPLQQVLQILLGHLVLLPVGEEEGDEQLAFFPQRQLAPDAQEGGLDIPVGQDEVGPRLLSQADALQHLAPHLRAQLAGHFFLITAQDQVGDEKAHPVGFDDLDDVGLLPLLGVFQVLVAPLVQLDADAVGPFPLHHLPHLPGAVAQHVGRAQQEDLLALIFDSGDVVLVQCIPSQRGF